MNRGVIQGAKVDEKAGFLVEARRRGGAERRRGGTVLEESARCCTMAVCTPFRSQSEAEMNGYRQRKTLEAVEFVVEFCPFF